MFAVFIYGYIYFYSLRKSLILKRGTTSSNSFTSLWKTEVTLSFLSFFYLKSTSSMAQHSKGTQILPEVFWFCFPFTKPFLCSQGLWNKPLVDFWLWQPWLRALLLLIPGWTLSLDGEIQPAENGVVPSSNLCAQTAVVPEETTSKILFYPVARTIKYCILNLCILNFCLYRIKWDLVN